jgi:acyl-CoA hydrolase
MVAKPVYFVDAEACADAIISQVGEDLVLGLPAGLGKANSIANALYERAEQDPRIQLEILTALTLGRIEGHSELERRFLEPLMDRLAGTYPELNYNQAIKKGCLPSNITVHEFFLPAGRMLDASITQQNYISINYTHVFRELLDRGINVIAQLVAQRDGPVGKQLSLSCNPDLTLDLIPELLRRRDAGEAVALAAQVNNNLPFMLGPAAIEAAQFDFIVNGPGCKFDLFSVPKQPVTIVDYAVALHVSRLIEDGGTLQIGIGGGADGLTQVLKLRHLNNPRFRLLIESLNFAYPLSSSNNLDPFDEGLYGSSEMLVEGFLELMKCGVVKRRVAQSTTLPVNEDGPKIHAGFFVGSRALLKQLRALPEDELADIAMTSISYVNQLYGDEELKRSQRRRARFVNNALLVTALGDVTSDELSDGRVISGVGGQYNFVAQAHELVDARSVIALNATRTSRGRITSNVVWDYGHITIPRHLRDIVVTEYGVADLRGKSDRDVIAQMLQITDSRFQAELLQKVKRVGKIDRKYEIPERFRANYPERLLTALGDARQEGILPEFPLGTEMTPIELRLLPALMNLRAISHSTPQLLIAALRQVVSSPLSRNEAQCLERLQLDKVRSLADCLLRWSVVWGLRSRNRSS